MMEHRVHRADSPDKVSVRHRKCCGTLFNGLLILLMRLSVWVNQGSTLELRTIVGAERGANACAEAGRRFIGMIERLLRLTKKKENAMLYWDGQMDGERG
jgi:hypothetical protein